MSNYTVEICKTLISTGITTKPADCEESIWNQAMNAGNFENFAQESTFVEETPAQNMGFAAFGANSSGSLPTDHKIKYQGGAFMVDGTSELLKTPFTAMLSLKKSQWKESIKTSIGSQVKYYHTLNYKTCSDGRNWQEVVKQCQAVDSNSYPYPSADLWLVPEVDLKDATGNVIVNAGESVSYTTPSTAKKMLMAFKNSAVERNLLNADEVKVRCSFERQLNKSNQAWYIISLELI